MAPLDKQYKNEAFEYVSEFYDKKWRKPNVNGSFLVAKNGQIIFEGYQGYSRIENKKKITPHTPIHLASVSKVLTAALTLRLVDEGKLKLDQDVDEILTPFPYQGVTLRMLLNHRSGIPNYAYFCDDRKVWNRSETLSNQDMLDLMNTYKFPQYFPSGKRFAYCNSNYALLALVIEKVTGMDYPTAMKTMVFDPLQMKDTFVFSPETDKESVSQSYKANKLRLAFDHLDGTYGDKNIYSTPRDLLKFDMATYADDFLSKEMKNEMFKGYSYESKGIRNYGLGVRMYEWETGQKMFFHNGWWHGNTSAYLTLRKDTVTIIALSNKYTKQTYESVKLAPYFGDYPIKGSEEE